MALLKHPDRKMNIPRLQPNPPTTEDMLMRREREMTALGGGEEGRTGRPRSRRMGSLGEIRVSSTARPR